MVSDPNVSMPTGELRLVLTTVGSESLARAIASELVERRLAACVHIDAIESVYEWQGRIESGPEWRLVIKTTSARYPEVEDAIRALHDYALPAILALPVTEALAPFAAWVVGQTAARPDAES